MISAAVVDFETMPAKLILPAEGPGSQAWEDAWDDEVYRRCHKAGLTCGCSGDRDCWKCRVDGPVERITEQVWNEMEALWNAQHGAEAA